MHSVVHNDRGAFPVPNSNKIPRDNCFGIYNAATIAFNEARRTICAVS
ncbi:MAG: hypothetical protein VXZ70_07290 [Pseudomonadota bacterium]|nr:hypothetical protein [Pseudomonadota bacterium]